MDSPPTLSGGRTKATCARPLPSAAIASATENGRTGVLIWDWQLPDQKVSNRPFFTKVLPATPSTPAQVKLSGLQPGSYRLKLHRTGFKANDAHTRYLEMGSPSTLSPEQLKELQDLTVDRPEIDRTVRVKSDGQYSLKVAMRTNDVVLLLLEPVAASQAR